MNRRRTYFQIVLAFLGTAGYGQPKVDHRHYSTIDGLSNGSVVNMMKDSRGFMWFSTWDGLNRFDGVNFRTFKTVPGDNLSLSSNRIMEMLEDKYNAIWLKTYDSKIFRLNLESEKFDDGMNRINSSLTGGIEQLFLSSENELWLATEQNGLYHIVTDYARGHLDIHQYTSDADSSHAIPCNRINFIFEDARQNIWFICDQGLFRLSRRDRFRVESLPPDKSRILGKYRLSCHYSLGDEILLGTAEGILLFYNPLENRMEELKISDAPITIIRADTGRIYAGSAGEGLYMLDRHSKQVRHSFNDPYLSTVSSIYEDHHGLLWLETNANGVVKVNPEDRSTKIFTQKVDVENVRHIISRCEFREVNDVLWISLKGGGFGYYDRGNDRLEYFYNRPGSPRSKMSNFTYCFYIDKTDVLWLSTYRKGIEKFTLLDNRFRFKAPDPGSANYLSNEVRALLEDHLGMLWLATKSGDIYLLDKEYRIVSHFSKEYRLAPALVYSIIEDKNRNIWLGTKGNGIYRISRQGTGRFSTEHFRHEEGNLNSLSDNNIYSIEEGSGGKLWIGTYGGGLNMLEMNGSDRVFKNNSNYFTAYPENSCRRIRQVKQDSRGNIWLATTEGLVFFDPQEIPGGAHEFHQFRKIPSDRNSLGNNDVYCIFQDRNDTLWFGTLGGGLQKLIRYPGNGVPARFEVFTTANGLSSDVIFSIEGDRENNLWMSSENGLIKYNAEKRFFRSYNEHDGIITASFSEAASAKRLNGDLVFGTYEGIYYFKPDDIGEKSEKTDLYFTGFNVLNETAPPGGGKGISGRSMVFTDQLVLNYNQNVFEISFAALDYRATPKIQYLYKLEGFDVHWRPSRIDNAFYTKVPPGKYTFRVRLLNPAIALNNPRSLQITIRKPYWKTSTAYVIYIFLALVLLFVALRMLVTMVKLRNKVSVEKQLSELKIDFFTNISHELRTPLTLIQGPAREIYRSEKLSSKGKEYLELISRNTDRMLRLVNQLLDFRKIQHSKMPLKLSCVSFDTFVRQICDSFKNMASEKEMDYLVEMKARDLKVWIDEEKMDTVIFNLLSNAFKFTPPGKQIHVVLDREGDAIRLSVRDQGIGIRDSKRNMVFQSFANIHDPSEYSEMSTGLGLSLSKELIELHGGTIDFESKPGSGTTFIVTLRPGRDHFDNDLVSFINGDRELLRSENRFETSPGKNGGPGEQGDLQSGNGQHETILIVEDNLELRAFLRDIFYSEFRVCEAGNGREGYEKSLQVKPQMILSDIMMPEMDGIEMLGLLREDFETSHIPVVLLTAKSSVESRIRGLKFGADAYVTKPFNSVYLRTLVTSIIEQRKKLISRFSGSMKITDFTDDEMVVTDRDGEFLKKVFEIIEKNLSDPDFKVDVISSSMGMGRTNFFDKLKGLTNLSPIELIKEYRLNKALLFMESGNYNISEISYRAGFQDPGYFSRCFREKYGKTPSRYLKEKRFLKTGRPG